MNTIELKEAVIGSVRAKVDRSLGLSISTGELTPPEKALFMELMNVPCKISFTPMDSPNAPVIRIDKEANEKSPSQRLRGTLFRYWEQLPNKSQNASFDKYYREYIEMIIDRLKERMEPHDE